MCVIRSVFGHPFSLSLSNRTLLPSTQTKNTLEQSIFTPEALAANPFGADMIAAQKEQQARETEVRHLIELPLPVLEACLKRFTVEEEADVNRLKRE